MSVDGKVIKKHWTHKAIFSLRVGYLAGARVIHLFADDRFIATGTFINPLVAELNSGRFDEELDFPAGPLDIPADYDKWNDGKLPIDLGPL